jgi:hypothetical protein
MSTAAIRLTAIGAVGNPSGTTPLRGLAGAAARRPVRRGARPPAADTGGAITRYQWRGSAMGRPAWLAVAAPGPAVLDAARSRLTELVGKWAPAGPHSEVARLNTYRGVTMSVSLDTVLLALLLARGPQRRGVWVDPRHGRAGFASDRPLDVTGAAAALASDLVVSDAWEAGAFGVSVRLGAVTRTVTGVEGAQRALRDIATVTLCQADVANPLAPVDAPRTVTVVADRAWRAHAMASRLLGVPASRATALLAGPGLAARLVRPDGAILDVGGFADAVRTAATGDGAEPELVEDGVPDPASSTA